MSITIMKRAAIIVGAALIAVAILVGARAAYSEHAAEIEEAFDELVCSDDMDVRLPACNWGGERTKRAGAADPSPSRT